MPSSTICSICCESIPFVLRPPRRRPCCKVATGKRLSVEADDDGVVCGTCLYRHISSILSENGGGGGGRSRISCPLGCGTDLTDIEIRTAIQSHHYSFWRHSVLKRLIDVYSFLILQLPFRIISVALLLQTTSWYERSKISLWMHVYNIQQRHAVTPSQRNELRLYEQWSVRTALATRTSISKEIEDVIYCPAPDCPNIWLLSHRFRQHKLANEPKSGEIKRSSRDIHNNSSRNVTIDSPLSSPRKMLDRCKNWRQSIRVATENLFYQPPKPEDELEYFEGSNPSELLFWVDSIDLQGNFISQKQSIDGRKLTCSLCSAEFCGLCRRPWVALRIDRKQQKQSIVSSVLSTSATTKRISHEGKSCDAFHGKIQISPTNKDDESYTFAAQAMHARCCPGCSMRTQRMEGCNHMICPCGTEWCYVCECNWSTFHYTCRLPDSSSASETAGVGCVVS
jgi:hypothetical protein